MKDYQLRLMDLENIASEKLDLVPIMKDVLGYKNYWFGRKFVFQNKSKKALELISEARNIDPAKVKLNPDCEIKVPGNIDHISFRAMMELRSTIGNSDAEKFTNTVAQIIAIVCYQANHFDSNRKSLDYDSNSPTFIEFSNKILQSPIWDMMGIYNWITEAEIDSQKMWSERFMSVYVEDEDFLQAGAESLSQFNIIKTIKTVCKDFNVSYEDAWQISYTLTQTNSYEIATTGYVQEQLRKLKEAKIKSKRSTGQ